MATVEDREYPQVVSPLTKGPITQFVLEGKQALSKSPEPPSNIRSMYTGGRREPDENTEFSMNPDPVPFQPSNFMSSTMMKKVPVSRRHFDTFNSVDFSSLGKRGMMLHTDRYQWDLAKALDGEADQRYMDRLLSLYNDKTLNLSQRERLQAELEYMERLRGIKRRREVLPHRAQLDLLMGGKKIEFTERFEIQREIQKLKSLILPQHARDLFHGRGFVLPEDHNSVKPRKHLPPEFDLDDDINGPFSPDKYSFNPETGRVVPKWQKQSEQSAGGLPKINNKGYLLGHGTPIILSKEKRTVDSIKARLRIPTSAPQPAYMTRSKTNVPSAQKHPPAVRSVTAHPVKKETRPTGTAPVKLQSREIKIPVSARDDSEAEGQTPGVPKPTPAPTTANRPEVEEVGEQPEDASGRPNKSERSASRSSMSPVKAATPNPLKGITVGASLTPDQQHELKRTFSRLDTDGDGHLMFSQLKTQLPKQFSQAQERYIKQVYEITSSSTFFGVDEFMTMSYLTNIVTALTGPALEAFSKIDTHSIGKSILEYVELFQSVDRTNKGKMSLDSLRDILTTVCTQTMQPPTDMWTKVEEAITLSEPGQITKIEFLAYLPFFEVICKGK